MEVFVKFKSYVFYLEKANIQMEHPAQDRIYFNGFDCSTLYLKDLLITEVSLFRAIRKGPLHFEEAMEKEIFEDLYKLDLLFYIHSKTLLIMRRDLEIRCHNDKLELMDLTRSAQEKIAEFIAEQQASLFRVFHWFSMYYA